MIDISELINDPDFSQDFLITRSVGSWVDDQFITAPQSIKISGIIQPINTTSEKVTPNGSQIEGAIRIWTDRQMYTTKLQQGLADFNQISDEITWQDQQWKVTNTWEWQDNGYYVSEATRKLGA